MSIDLKSLQKAGFNTGGGGESSEAAEKQAAMEEARQSMLKSIMSPEAKQRLDRVALVRPENARAVEEHLIKLARSGKLGGGKVDEGSIVKLLEDVGKFAEERSGAVKKVTIQRKKRMDDDDSDLEGL